MGKKNNDKTSITKIDKPKLEDSIKKFARTAALAIGFGAAALFTQGCDDDRYYCGSCNSTYYGRDHAQHKKACDKRLQDYVNQKIEEARIQIQQDYVDMRNHTSSVILSNSTQAIDEIADSIWERINTWDLSPAASNEYKKMLGSFLNFQSEVEIYNLLGMDEGDSHRSDEVLTLLKYTADYLKQENYLRKERLKESGVEDGFSISEEVSSESTTNQREMSDGTNKTVVPVITQTIKRTITKNPNAKFENYDTMGIQAGRIALDKSREAVWMRIADAIESGASVDPKYEGKVIEMYEDFCSHQYGEKISSIPRIDIVIYSQKFMPIQKWWESIKAEMRAGASNRTAYNPGVVVKEMGDLLLKIKGETPYSSKMESYAKDIVAKGFMDLAYWSFTQEQFGVAKDYYTKAKRLLVNDTPLEEIFPQLARIE